MIYLKLVLAIIVRTIADVSFKAAVHRLDFDSFSTLGTNIKRLALSPFLWMGGAFGVVNVILWTSCLETFDLSYAYPFLSLSYVTIMISGKLFFDETLDWHKVVGIFFIGLGACALFLG